MYVGIQHYTLEKIKQLPIGNEIKKRKWRWIELQEIHSGNLQKPSPVKHETTQGRGEGVGHETPGRETRKKKQRRWDTPGEKWTGWPRTENGGVPWSMAYAPSKQRGSISMYVGVRSVPDHLQSDPTKAGPNG